MNTLWQRYPFTTQCRIIAAAGIFIKQGAQDVIGSCAVGQAVEEIEGDAVIPVAECQQMVVRLWTNQPHGFFSFAGYPRFAVVFIHEIFRAFSISPNAEFHLIIWISLAR